MSTEVRGEVVGVRRVPCGEALRFEVADGRVSFTVPRLTGQEVVEIAYAGG